MLYKKMSGTLDQWLVPGTGNNDFVISLAPNAQLIHLDWHIGAKLSLQNPYLKNEDGNKSPRPGTEKLIQAGLSQEWAVQDISLGKKRFVIIQEGHLGWVKNGLPNITIF